MGYYDGDSWTYHVENWIECAECESYFDDQEKDGNICPTCVSKSYETEEGESNE